MIPNMPNSGVQLNPIKHRLLFISPEVAQGLHKEACTKDFSIKSGLGQGAFGRVFKVERRSDKQVFAIKQIPKQLVKQQDMVKQIVNEVQIMYKLKHPNIIELYDHFEEEEFIYLILEYAGGGQLWHKLNEVRRFDERTVQKFMKDITTAVEFLHSRNPPIIHRDIKPENLLLDIKGNVKLADFGWSNFFNDSKRQTYGGTLDYLAPEMIAESGHDLMLDVWSLGVLIFEFLTGIAPFTPTQKNIDPKESQKLLEKNIMNLNIKFPNDFPLLAKDLVLKLLKKQSKQRLPISEIKKHPWLKDLFDEDAKQQIKLEQQQQQLQKEISTESSEHSNESKVQQYKQKIEQQQLAQQALKQNNSGIKNQPPNLKGKQELELKLKQRSMEIEKQEQQQQQQQQEAKKQQQPNEGQKKIEQQQQQQQQQQKQQQKEEENEDQINLLDSDEEENITTSQPIEPSEQLVKPEQLKAQPKSQEPQYAPSHQSQNKFQQISQNNNINNNDLGESPHLKSIEVRKLRLLEHQNQMLQQEQDKMWEHVRITEDELQKLKFELESKQRIIDELQQAKIDKQSLQEKLRNHQESHQSQISQLQSQIEELKLKHELEQKKFELTHQTNTSTNSTNVKNFAEIIPLLTTLSENVQKVLDTSQINHKMQATLLEYEKELASLKSQQATEFQTQKMEITDKFEDEIEQLQTNYHTEIAKLSEEKCTVQLQLENEIQKLQNQVDMLQQENQKKKMIEQELEMERSINHESKTELKNLRISKDSLVKEREQLKNKLLDAEAVNKNLRQQLSEIKKK